MRPCARPRFDGRPELCPVGGGDAEPDRGAGGAEGLPRREDHRDHGVLALLTELIFEGFGRIADHTSECTAYFYCSRASVVAPHAQAEEPRKAILPGPWRSHGLVSPFRRGGRAGPVLRARGGQPRATSRRRERGREVPVRFHSASSEDSAAEKPNSANRSRRHSSSRSSCGSGWAQSRGARWGLTHLGPLVDARVARGCRAAIRGGEGPPGKLLPRARLAHGTGRRRAAGDDPVAANGAAEFCPPVSGSDLLRPGRSCVMIPSTAAGGPVKPQPEPGTHRQGGGVYRDHLRVRTRHLPHPSPSPDVGAGAGYQLTPSC